MPENNPLQPEVNQPLMGLLAPYFEKYYREKCYLGLSFQQGKRTMIQINVPADDLPTLLQAKPSIGNDPDSGKNRPEVKGHAEEIKEYILKRVEKGKPWVLGTLTANVTPGKINIIELGRGICLVVIPRGVKLDITDGQHRKRAIHELIESTQGELIGDNNFPITLVLEENFNQCQIDFKDMAQTRQLDKSLLLSFGEFEGRVGITKTVLERVPMFEGKTEKIKGSPETKKRLIYTTNYIAKLVSCAFADDPNNELKDYDVESSSEALISCLNQLFSECSQTKHIFETTAGELTIEEVGAFKEECILGRSVGLEILGHLLYCTYDKNRDYFEAEKISKIAQLNWSKDSHIWEGNIVLSSPDPKNPGKSYRITASASAVRMAISMAKANLGWM
ncbi:DNA sulfur modification protein DndB [Trichocoleus sp. ST-U3]|uniref:DNA sulfur modification protein DndB n=1 Tax=Coleofasciculus sp. FACHB-542 TaxID=2692787 RepID=UPI0016854987|nr:DNA sulfur modification protein DndB [Coleofasciculus sp. FACHB-542]MBD2085494.1 DNA sulfur modification protein DndB [Coleofasciculus sp. FACHB-542]